MSCGVSFVVNFTSSLTSLAPQETATGGRVGEGVGGRVGEGTGWEVGEGTGWGVGEGTGWGVGEGTDRCCAEFSNAASKLPHEEALPSG
mmetsp:Transcript_9045/g.13889  ORF Transcript_9045/g.13889 Transcript_9045/m.13889 type:complete len:89 (+) Transcript_9045:984-1250(+)